MATGQESSDTSRKAGREYTLEETLTAVLRERFGSDPEIPVIATQLANGWNEHTTIQFITAAKGLDDIRSHLPRDLPT